jgi:hypothetical protein
MTDRHARIVASLRDDALSVAIGARDAESFIAAYDAAVADGVVMPEILAAFRASLSADTEEK